MSQNHQCRRITVAEMAPHIHNFLPGENKINKISDWLIVWIKDNLNKGVIRPNDFLPSKGELAFHIGVSLGTIQNVYRILEDKGLVESRQKIGTYIKNPEEKSLEKLTSKREVAKELIKKYITDKKYKAGDALVSARKISAELAIPFATIRIAINSLISEGIISKQEKSFIINTLNFDSNSQEQQTLVEKISEYINLYIKNNLKYGDKLPSNNALADMYNVSIKTIHDAIKILALSNIVKTRRGYYGTVVVNQKEDNKNLYFYEQAELLIKKYIAENCDVGAKLPSIKAFSEALNVSAKTIKNAMDNLEYDGYISCARGKNGGTFVQNIPIVSDSGYTWLALSPEFEQKN